MVAIVPCTAFGVVHCAYLAAEQATIGAMVSITGTGKNFSARPTPERSLSTLERHDADRTVYVNGTAVGSHDNSGYTGFFFDISNYVVKGDTTCIALQCNIVETNLDLPPGDGGATAPDFEFWSGMYRDVTLLFKNYIYVPLWGQSITATGSTASPTWKP